MMSDVEEKRCPLCTEEMDLTDKQLKPCKCGYEICVWCWNHIMDMAEKDKTEGRCPACRTIYDKEKIVSAAASLGRLVSEINLGKKAKSQKVKAKANEGRKHLTDVRVVQRHLAYIMGLPTHLTDEEVLARKEYFGQYGKVLKVSLSRTSAGVIQYFPNDTVCVYITYSKEEEAVRCIQSVHGYVLEGKPLRACFGTTKYCHTWLRNMPCNNPDCLYLHEIGSHEDSFTKDEIVSAYTRSRVQQITGANNNLQRTSGNVLPPPLDDFSIGGTASGKPISRISSSNPLSKVKVSPPDDSSGRSVGLPAAASWGLRASNGQPPNATSACSNVQAKQNLDGHTGSSGFSAVVAGTTPTCTVNSDGRNRLLVNEIGHVVHSNRELESFGYSKKYTVKESHELLSDTPEEVVRDAAPSSANSLSSSPASNDDDSSIILHNVACSVERRGQPCVPASVKDDNVAVNKTVQSLCSGLSSVGIDSHLYSEHFDCTAPGDSFSSHPLSGSSRPHDLHQSYPQHARGPSSLLPSKDDGLRDVIYHSREFNDWGPVSQNQGLKETSGAVEEELLGFGCQSVKASEIEFASQFPYTSNSKIPYTSNSNILNATVPFSQQNSIISGTSSLGSGDPRKVHSEVAQASIPFASSDFILPNGYNDNKISSSAELRSFNHFNSSNFERGRYMGRSHTDEADFAAIDMGESRIISNILSLDLDACDESLASPHNLAGLWNDRDRQLNSLKNASSRKVQGSSQSRFSFARQEDYGNEITDFGSFYNTGPDTNRRSVPLDSRENQDIYLDEFRRGLSCRLESHPVSSSNPNISNRLSVSRAPVSAPPGFSAHNKAPPPGFSTQQRMDPTLDALTASQLLRSSSSLKNHYHVQRAANLGSIEDAEFIDPAILAVGRGRQTNVANNLGLDMSSYFSSQLGASESDRRLQLLMQQSILEQQNLRYADTAGDRFSHLRDAYNAPSKHVEQAPFLQQSIQSRNAHTSNGWQGWNEVQSGNEMGVAELLGNERLGFSRYFPGYENLKYQQVHNSASLYNRAFGI